MKYWILIALLGLCASNVFAAGPAKVSEVAVRTVALTNGTNEPSFWVTLDGWLASEGNRPCSSINSRWAYIGMNEDNYQTFVAVLLAAKASGSEVNLGVQATSKSDGCHITDIYWMK